VHVKVRHTLPGVFTLVDHQAIARRLDAFLSRNLPSNPYQPADELLISRGDVCDTSDMTIGDNKDVGGRLRRDVSERRNALALVHDSRWNIPGGDQAK
jgi:hypothetical protein